MNKVLIFILFIFSTMPANDRGYGLGRSAGEFPVVIATKEMRAQNPLSARQPACEHRRVLAAGRWLCIVVICFVVIFSCLSML